MTKNNRAASPIDMIVGSNLRMIRTSKKMSQTALADKVGITFQQIQKYEKGANRIGASRLWQFCQAFGCEPGDFFTGIEDEGHSSGAKTSERTDLYQHPRGPAIANAFLSIDDKDVENQIIAMCRTLGMKKAS